MGDGGQFGDFLCNGDGHCSYCSDTVDTKTRKHYDSCWLCQSAVKQGLRKLEDFR